jgi:hypothetical protein
MDNTPETNSSDTVINNAGPRKGSLLAGFLILLVIAAILLLIMKNRPVEDELNVPPASQDNQVGTGTPAQNEATTTADESASIENDLESMNIDGISDGI